MNYYSDKKSIHKLSGGEDTVIYNGSDIEKIHLVSGDYLYFSEHFKNSTRTEEYTALSRINLKTNVKEPLYSHRAAGSGYFFGW